MGAFFVAGPSQDEKHPHGGQQAEGVARGPFPSPGRNKKPDATKTKPDWTEVAVWQERSLLSPGS
ncbi:hypothetical protein D3M96_13075 [Alcaligenes aquatilis]|uniref:Uncharacterized protein n=1 Tax=Alcaligenes aquatilis TaxID=323284 RepID=A0A3G2HW33_9BURK|nr:hypothetical protein D3M96_13075 [Alcaligenes aquatilis]